MDSLSHITDQGEVNMVDVSSKGEQLRIAKAYGFISLSAITIELIKEDKMKKGNVLTTAEIAAISAAKKCSELIPLCHNIPLTKVEAKATLKENGVEINTTAKCIGRTGVEMEALTSASIALLTIYDMCKAVDKNMIINSIKLISKTKENCHNEPLE
jgi:cyclic pyranopterin monophosphate synthase